MIRLIDVLWLDGNGQLVAAFVVEHSTSIYSGMLDLALGAPEHMGNHYYLVAPDSREQDVRLQFSRPAFSRVQELKLRYLPYGELREHRHAIARFGSGLKGMEAISRLLVQ